MGCREDELVRLHTCDRVDDTLRIGGAHGQSKRKWGGWSSPLGVGVVSGGLSRWVGAQVSIGRLRVVAVAVAVAVSRDYHIRT